MRLETLLPPESFITFEARSLGGAFASWKNNKLELATPLAEYALLIPLNKDPKRAYSATTTTFLAERYGGQGLGSNGGGVRCGLLNGVQAKGIGRNPLAGRDADFFHSYGGASLNEGMAEAIWGEVIHSALPHGACRVFGLITTGTRVPLLAPKPGQDPTTARALIVRQALLRPAHYMRSPYFDPVDDRITIISDTDRTRAAVATLSKTLHSIYNAQDAPLNDMLHTMFGRAAEQLAAARAKRIMHGSLIDSNWSLDGRWLDFGTTSTLPDHGRYFISPGSPDFLHEHMILRRTMKDFIFYLRKYLPQLESATLCSDDEIWAEFLRVFEQQLPIQFCKLTGVSPTWIQTANQATINQMYAVIQKIIGVKSQASFSLCEAESSGDFKITDVPTQLSKHHLGDVLQAVSHSFTPAEIEQRSLMHITDARLREDFVRNFWNIRNEYLDTFGDVQRSNAQTFLGANSFRVNTSLPEFFRPTIYGDIERCLLSGNSVSEFVDNRVAVGKAVVADAIDDAIELGQWFNGSISISVANGIISDGQALTIDAFLRLPENSASAGKLKQHIANRP
jgi:hypothetical protein